MSGGGEAPKRNRRGEGDSELSQPFNVARRVGHRLGRSVPPMTLILRSMVHVGGLGHDAGSAGATSLVARSRLSLCRRGPTLYIYIDIYTCESIPKYTEARSK